jgi:hypothetical protein
MKATSELWGVTELLDTLSHSSMSKCPRCGFPLEHRKAVLFSSGKSETWDITLPFCFRCKLACRKLARDTRGSAG